MKFMTQADWDEYIQVMNDWQEDTFQQPITWVRSVVVTDVNGEGTGKRFVNIPLKCLVQYNYFRSWPITKINDAGEVDKESLLAFFNIKALADEGYVDEHGQLMFDPGMDRFILNGVEYKAMGESQAAQAHDKPLFFFIILKREEIETGQEKYG